MGNEAERGPYARRNPEAGKRCGYSNRYDDDRYRILHSSAFRRLAGVTQVAPATESHLLHNRLTHSLKVAEVGRRLIDHICECEEYEEEDRAKASEIPDLYPGVIETAGLAHDLGHPPFGHAAESVLNEFMVQAGLEGFEGNAQTFRIVTKVALRGEGVGLNLTRGSLNAILKYPCLLSTKDEKCDLSGRGWISREYGDKWGVFDSEKKILAWAREGTDPGRRSAAAMIMDWADDIAYAIHDVEDYYRAGLIPLHRIKDDRDRIIAHGVSRLQGRVDSTEFTAAFRRVLDGLPFDQPFTDSIGDRQALYDFTESKIADFVKAVGPTGYAPYIKFEDRQQYEVEVLKELTWFYVIHNPSLALAREGHEKVLRELLKTLTCWLGKDENGPNIPRTLARLYASNCKDSECGETLSRSKDARIARSVCDYICTLTDAQAVEFYERLIGLSRTSIFETWLTY